MTEKIELFFPKLNHFWLDSGLLGFTVLLLEIDTNIETIVNDEGVTLIGLEDKIQKALESAYTHLIKRYYDLSTKKQRDDITSYNFYYDSNEDKFIAFPKKNSVGIAGLIFGKQLLPSDKQVMWEEKITGRLPKEKSEQVWKWKKIGTLPDDIENFQNRINEFAEKNSLKIGLPAGLLVDGPNEVIPKVVIKVKKGATKGTCYLCGLDSHHLADINQTTFPFITSSSGVLSFNSQGGKPEKVCWKCAFIGKFVPVNGFYLTQGDNLYAFFPYSVSLTKMKDVYDPLQDTKYEDPGLFKNFKHPLGFENFDGGYFQKPFEVSFAFLYTLYNKKIWRRHRSKEEELLDFNEMCDFALSKAPLEFVMLYTESKGQTSTGKLIWPFTDSVYFFRLIKEIEDHQINIKEAMRLLINFSQKKNENKTIIRNRVCERILKKQSVIDLIESHIFSIENTFIKPLIDFIFNYESLIRKEGGSMTVEEQESAVTLGKRIGMVVGREGKKGDLFALRKARRKSDFLNELNRLQFKCKLTVPPDVYEGKLTDLNFVEFKQFCMVAALNSFYAASQPQKG